MDFFELLKQRYSVRKFSDMKVEDEKINKILEAGRLAPTACNFQPQRYIVIKSAEGLEKLKKCTKYTFGAPMAILVCYNKKESWKRSYDRADSGETDASIAVTQMMLSLVGMGLGSTWVGYFDPAAIRSEFGIPENLIPHALLPIGYPADDARPSSGHGQRRPLSEVTQYV